MDQFETEEQQVEAIKRFWKENGTALIVGAVLGLGGLWGWRYYTDVQIETKEQASIAYQEAVDGLTSEQGFTQGKAFLEEETDSGYAYLVALELAKQAIDSGDLTEAATQLQFVADNAATLTVKSVAQVRLARVQIEQGELDTALSTAEQIKDDAFASASQEIKGDIYLAKQMIDKARAAYSAAIEENANNPTLKMKLDNLTAVAKS